MAEIDNKKNIYTIENNELIINWSVKYEKVIDDTNDFP